MQSFGKKIDKRKTWFPRWIKCTHCPFSILRMHITEHRNSQIRSVGINIVDSICMLTSYFWAFSGPICSYKNTHNMLYMMTIRSKSPVYMWQECVDWTSLTWGNNTQWGVSNDITDRTVLLVKPKLPPKEVVYKTVKFMLPVNMYRLDISELNVR